MNICPICVIQDKFYAIKLSEIGNCPHNILPLFSRKFVLVSFAYVHYDAAKQVLHATIVKPFIFSDLVHKFTSIKFN